MKKCLLFLGSLVVILNTNSCKNDLEAIAPYKESIAVYAMLDPTDSVNYIRVNRVFLGAGDANSIAQVQDSVYFKPGQASVVVEKYWNGVLRQKYNFSETYEVPLQPGVFNVNQLIYKSTQKFKSDSAGKYFDYVLKVLSVRTNTTFESEIVNMVKDISSLPSQSCGTLGANCFFSDPNSNVTISPFQNFAGANQTKIKFATPKNCKAASAKLRFYYTEKYLNTSSASKYFDFDLGDFDAETANGGEAVDFSFAGYTFYNALNTSIPSNDGVFERVADSMRFYFYFGGNELSLYKEINNTSGSFGQEKPIYTNMKNGAVGVFSSRSTLLINKRVFRCGVSNQVNVISESFLNFLRDSNYPYCRMLFRGVDCAQNSGC